MMMMMTDKEYRPRTFLLMLILLYSSTTVPCNATTRKSSPPTFVKEIKQYHQVNINATVRFVCRFKGWPKPNISWYHFNEPLQKNERTTIKRYSVKISPVRMSDYGTYYCKVKNGFGEIWGNFTVSGVAQRESLKKEANAVENTKIEANKIKSQLEFADQTMVHYIAQAELSSVTLDCSIQSNQEAIITWTKDNNIKIAKQYNKFVMEGFVLTILSLSVEDEGNYMCTVSNSHGNISHTWTLVVQQRVLIAPIIEAIDNQTVSVGNNVTFECKVLMSESTPLIQWLRHYTVNDSFTNEKGEPYVTIMNQFNGSEDNKNSLVLYNITESDKGWYSCVAANSVGMNYISAWLEVLNDTEIHDHCSQSNAVNVGMMSSPTFVEEIKQHHQVNINGTVRFVCKFKGWPKPNISWYHFNEPLQKNERTTIKRYSVKISPVRMSDYGTYYCKVKNGFGEIWGNFTVSGVAQRESLKKEANAVENTKIEANKIKSQLEFADQTMVYYIARAELSSVTLDCSIQSNQEAIITWTKDNNIKIAEQYNKFVMEGFVLTILSLSVEDEGNYMCTVSNSHGNISHTWTLVVQQRVLIAPIIEAIDNQTVSVGNNVTFECKVLMSESTPLIQWLRHYTVNDSFTNEKGEPYVTIMNQFNGSEDNKNSLVLYNITESDKGWYSCVAANTVGMNYRSAWLEVLELIEVDLDNKRACY